LYSSRIDFDSRIYSTWKLESVASDSRIDFYNQIEFGIIDFDQNSVEGKTIYLWIYSCKSELNKKFEFKNQL
jgi:hypothetical protein